MNAGANAFYVAGGTLRPDAPSYVERGADQELFASLLRGEFCFALTSRQMGKSSLMVRTVRELRKAGVAVAVLDLTAIGQNLTVEQWYDGLLTKVGQQLQLEEQLESFWQSQERLGALQRWITALEKVVLCHCPGPIVFFADEIDVVRSLPFPTDEFFAGLRECYNRRSQDTRFNRLTFCLLGVAAPTDLIRDTQLTPFNIGRRIELNDFTLEEAAPLAKGFLVQSPKSEVQSHPSGPDDQSAQLVIGRIFYWTNGHPYLTQRLCRAVAEEVNRIGESENRSGGEESPPTRRHAGSPVPELVDTLCEELFLSLKARERDDNLIFVRERLLNSGADRASILDLYNQVRRGKKVPDDDTNPLISVLRLSGITRAENGYLQIRNRIYERVFDRNWILSNLPDAELQRQRRAFRRGLVQATALGAVLLLLLLFAAIYQQPPRIRAQQLPDGSILSLEKTEYGKLHVYEPGRFQTWWLHNLLPKPLKSLIPSGGGVALGTAEDSLFIWTRREGTNLPPLRPLRWVMFNEFGAELDAGVLTPNGSTKTRTPFPDQPGFRLTEINGWEIKAFPRRGHKIGIRLFDRDPQDRNRWRQIAHFTVGNPTRSLYSVWSPEPLPIYKKADNLGVTLLNFNSGIADPGLEQTWRPANPNENEVTGLKFQLLEDGKPALWLPRLVELSDATGNRFTPHNWEVHTSDQLGTAFLYVASDLGANEAWKARVEFTTAKPNYSSNETWTVSQVRLPARGSFTQSSAIGVISGATVQLLGIASAGAPLPGGTSLQLDDDPTINVRLVAPTQDFRLELVTARSDTGRELTPSASSRPIDGDFANALYAWSFNPPPGTSSLDLTFAVYRSRTVDFLAMPSRLPKEKTQP